MDECLLPSEIARLVFGYLNDEGCTEAAQKFLETSENLKECHSRSSQGVRFRTRVLGFNLVEMLQLVSSVYSLVEERTRRTPVPKEIAHGSFLEQLNYLLNSSDQSGGSELTNSVAENNTGLLKVLNRTMLENTTFHKKLAENINKMRTTPEGLAPETIAESIVKETGFDELIEELLDAVPVTDATQTGGKSSKENRPIRTGSNIHSTKDDIKKKTPDNSFDTGKLLSNDNQNTIEDENAAAVQSILESCRMPSWKGGNEQADCVSKSTVNKTTVNRRIVDSPSRQPPSLLDKAMLDCVTPLKEIAFKTYNDSCALQQSDEHADSESGGGSVNGDVCHSVSAKPQHSHVDSSVGLASPQLLSCTPVLLVCDSPNSQNQHFSLGVSSCNLHTRAEDRRIKTKFRRILPKPTNTSTLESNGKISFPNGLTLKVLNPSTESSTANDSKDTTPDKKDSDNRLDKIGENQVHVDGTVAKSNIDENVIGDVNENVVVEEVGLPDIQESKEVQVSCDNLGEKEQVKADLCSAESLVKSQDQSSNNDRSTDKDKITPVDRQGSRRKLSLSTPRRGRHIRSLDFATPNKKILGQRSKTSPKQILHQPKFRSKLRSNLFKSPPNKLQTIQDAVEKDEEEVEKNAHGNDNVNQEVSTNVEAEKNISELLKADDGVEKKVESNCASGKSKKSKIGESTWDSNLRALIGENTNNCTTIRRPRKKQTRKLSEMGKRSTIKKIEEINEVNLTDELHAQTSGADASCVQKISESLSTEAVAVMLDKGNDESPTISGIELKTSPQLIFQTPLKFDQSFIPQTPILDTPLLKSIIDDTKIIDPDLLLTPSFQMTPFKPKSEKKVLVQTLSPSKMLTNKSSEKLKVESAKKSPTLRSNKTTCNAKSNNVNQVNSVSPKSKVLTTRQRNNEGTRASKNMSKKNGTSGKSDLIQSLMKQAEKNILGSLSDMESDGDEETEITSKSDVKCSKKGSKKHKLNNSDTKVENVQTRNKSGSEDNSIHKDEANASDQSPEKVPETEKSSKSKRKSPLKKDLENQDFTGVEKNKISPVKDSVTSNTHHNQSVKENVEALSKSESSSVISNLSNENKETTNSPEIVKHNNSSTSCSFPPKKKYVQTILLSSSTSLQSKKLTKVKNVTVNSNIVPESSLKPNSESVIDKSSEDNPTTSMSSFTDQQTIDFLLEKKKRLLNKLKEPSIKLRKEKNCPKVSSASTPVQKRIGSLINIRNNSKIKSKVNSNGNKKDLTASKCTNESLSHSSDELFPLPIQTSTPYVDKISNIRNNAKKNLENKFSPSNRSGKTFSEITNQKNPCNTPNPTTDRVERGVLADQNHHVSQPINPSPLDKREAGKRILVGNELYEHVFHDENRPIKTSSQRSMVDDKDLSISIFDVDMDGNEFETVFVAQPLNTLFEFVPLESKNEVQVNRIASKDHGIKKDSQLVESSSSSVIIVSKPPVVNGSCSQPVDRTSRLVQLASNRIPISNQHDKPCRDRENQHNQLKNLDSYRNRHTRERSRDRYSSSSSPPRRSSHERYRRVGGKTKSNKRTERRNRLRSRDRSRERRISKSHHRDKSRGKSREESKRDREAEERRRSRTDSSSRSKDRSRSLDKVRRKETRREPRSLRKHRDKSSSSRTKHHDNERQNERPKKNNRISTWREDESEDGEVRSKDEASSDECQSAADAASNQNQPGARSLNDTSTARLSSRNQFGKRPANDDSKIIAEKRPKTDDAQKLLKNMDSEHLEKFLSVVHPED